MSSRLYGPTHCYLLSNRRADHESISCKDTTPRHSPESDALVSLSANSISLTTDTDFWDHLDAGKRASCDVS